MARAAQRVSGMSEAPQEQPGSDAPTKYTPESLKAMPLPQRYDAMREVIEQRLDIGDVILADEFRRLCVRRTWPKERKHPTFYGFGKADRWNFNPLYKTGSTEHPFKLPPSMSASSPDALYRLLHVVCPHSFGLRDGDYYQGEVFRFYSPNRRQMCAVMFQKHELQLVFLCRKRDLFVPDEPTWPEEFRSKTTEEERLHWTDSEEWWKRKRIEVPNADEALAKYHKARDAYDNQGLIVPWCSRRMRCKTPEGQAWMRLVVAVANTAWDLYHGNNFRV